MKIGKKMFLVLLFLLIGTPVHAKLPMAEHPTEMEREFYASFAETWELLVRVLENNGTIIMNDNASGLLAFRSFFYYRIYMNFYVKSVPTSNTTVVYMTSHLVEGPEGLFSMGREQELNIEQEITRRYFEKLEEHLISR